MSQLFPFSTLSSLSVSGPDTEQWPWVAGGIAGSLTAYLLVTRAYGRDKGVRPPGPKPRPIIGNLPDFPKTRWYEKFCEWQKEYGDIVYIDLMGKHLLVINSYEDAEQLATKRSRIYSGRPYVRMFADLMDFGWSISMRQPGKEFNEQRKVFRKGIGAQSVTRYNSLVKGEAERFVQKISGFAGDPMPSIESAVAAVIIKLAYGEKTYREHGEELINLNKALAHHVGPVRTTFYLVSVFSWLRYVPEWFPGAHFQTVARIGKELTRRTRNWLFGLVAKDIENGVADPCLVTSFLNDPEMSNDSLKDATALLYGAGVDTTSSAIVSYFHHMAIHPDIQKKLQQEIDEKTGRGHTPSVEECLKLEYLQATWKESLRMAPIVPIGLPHTALEEDNWNGYFIPNKTIVNLNIGFMMHDPRIWGPDVKEFKPERFMGEKAKELPDPSSLSFGFGKRICPGRFLAERQSRTFIAATLGAYDILPMDGETIPHPMTYNDGLIRHPTDFRCQFKPRI